MSKLKAYLGAGFLAFLGILGLILKNKQGKIKELELKIRKDGMEKDLQDARKEVSDHKAKVSETEEKARISELRYRQAIKEYKAAKENGDSK
jgi:hypothetical protein